MPKPPTPHGSIDVGGGYRLLILKGMQIVNGHESEVFIDHGAKLITVADDGDRKHLAGRAFIAGKALVEGRREAR